MTKAIVRLPAMLRRSVTWTKAGSSRSTRAFTLRPVSRSTSANRHSHGSRFETRNTNGLLRQIHAEGDGSVDRQPAKAAAIADSLNTRPRETLAWMTPSEKLVELIATTV